MKTISLAAFYAAYFSCILYTTAADDERNMTTLSNGCTLSTKSGDWAFTASWWYTPVPYINCTGTGAVKFDVEGIADIQSLTASYNNISNFEIDDLKNFTKIRKIDLSSNRMQSLVSSKSGLILPLVSYLTLAQNNLSVISNEALKSFPNVTSFIVHTNQITAISADAFAFNRKLRYVYLGPNPISTFDDGWILGLSLRKLNMRGCGLSALPSAISNLTGLGYLDMTENSISNIPANAFSNCTDLRWVELAGNKITSVHEDAFKGASKLNYLDLSENLLETLQPKTFDVSKVDGLEIALYDNMLNCNCSMAGFKIWLDQRVSGDASTEIRFKCMQPLRNHGKRSSDMSVDDFSCQKDDVMWKDCQEPAEVTSTPVMETTPTPGNLSCPSLCTCLDKLGNTYYSIHEKKAKRRFQRWYFWMASSYPRVDCSDSNYTSLPDKIPDVTVNLYFTGNQFSIVDIKDLDGFQKLNTLRLTNNSIASLKPSPDTILPALKMLDISRNMIKILTKQHLKSFPNLTVLTVHHNLITVLSGDLFFYNRKLYRLYLGPNPIKKLNEDFMANLTLRSLSMRNMSLKTIPQSIGKMVDLSYVDFSDNLITKITNHTFSTCAKLYSVDLDNNRISSLEEDSFNGATSLSNVHLSENLIASLPGSLFSNVSSQRLNVDLWQNRFACDCKMRDFKEWLERGDIPSLEIRFFCSNPLRMHGRKSESLSTTDFVCKDDDVAYLRTTSSNLNMSKPIALSVVLTFLSTAITCFVVWKCSIKRKGGLMFRYSRQKNDFE